jgi:hypothetical protein
VLHPVAPLALRPERLQGASEVGLGEAGVGPGAQVRSQGVDIGRLVGEVGRQAEGGVRDRLDELGEAAGVVRGQVDRAVGLLGQAQLLDGGLELRPARVGAGR